MQNKMSRFLSSLGIADPSLFDLDFELVGRDSANPNKVIMAIRKETPWEMSLLEEFQTGLSTVKYDYAMRFSYCEAPSFESVDQLFEDWYLSHYHGIPPFQLVPGEGSAIHAFIPEGLSQGTMQGIIEDFNALLSWLSYSFKVTLEEGNAPIEEPKDPNKEKKNQQIQENAFVPKAPEKEVVAPAPIPEASKPVAEKETPSPVIEGKEEKDDDKDEDDKEENCGSSEEDETKAGETVETPDSGSDELPPIDEDEAAHQSQMAEYEKTYMAEQKVAVQAFANSRVFIRGDYQEHASIAELFNVPSGNVEFSGNIYVTNFRVGRRGGLYGTIGVGDATSAINIRAIESKNGMNAEFLNALKAGELVKIRGAIEFDKRTNERQVFAHYIDILPPPPLRSDPSVEKRVELHLHTKMSAMDGLGEIQDYCDVAKSMGMTAIAVTDHGVIQSFPAAESAGKKDGLKILYGCEFYMFDFPTYVFNPVPVELRKARYCVFDFETTGLSSRYDHPTEFGGVIVENGMITKRFDQFINPGVHIPEMITAKTHIDDSMVKDAPGEVAAAKILSDFIGDAVLVSHNAPFDVGFLNAMRAKAGMPPITNPVIDTLALSHYLFPEAARHTLGALSRNLNLDVYDESDAHRADYDAEALNNVWQTIIPILTKTNEHLTQADLQNLVSTNQSIFKHLRSYHMVAIAKNQAGLKALYRLISDSHTTFLSAGSLPKISRGELIQYRENLLFGSACFNGEIFEIGCNKSQQELEKAMAFYDYIEIQPPENYSWLVNMGELTQDRLMTVLKTMVDTADGLKKPVCATGDCHYVNPEDKILRDIYIAQKALGGGNHPLNPARREKMGKAFPNPDQHFRSTEEMMAAFRPFLSEEKCHEIVITNTNWVANQVEPIQILKDHLYPPSANLPNSDVKLREIISENIRKTYGDHPDPAIPARIEQELKGIIANGYSVTYYIAHCIIKKANEEGYIVGSRGSVGSSFVATMSGITEVNPLAPHYLCHKCHHFEWSTDSSIKSGFDLPEKKCPVCGEIMEGNGQNIPFQTFLGFNAEKVPDIDLNFPADYQSKAHAYTRTLLSTPEENEKIAKGEFITSPHVIRAGTIATAEEKNAFGYVRGYYERVLHQEWGTVNKAWAAYLAARCAGVKRTTGQHPGGIVVIPADMDIFDFTPYQHPADDPNADWLTTHYEFASMHDSVLKLDLLGHVDPMALRMMSLLTGVNILEIPMNDQKVLSLFSSPKALGLKNNPLDFKTGAIALPEFGTSFVQGLLEEALPHTFNDLLIISGLSHGTNVWNDNAEALIKNRTTTLQGVIGCRDDIMNDLIGYGIDNSKAFKIMEYVRKNKVGKPLKQEDIDEMKKHNVPDYFIESCKKIRYLFPRAHATAYVMGAVRVAWFKIYKPLEFYATYFTVRCDKFDVEAMTWPLPKIVEEIHRLQDASKIPGATFQDRFGETRKYSDKDGEILKTLIAAAEMVDRGYHIKNIDLMRSLGSDWVVDKEDNAIIPPFSVISGLGAAAADTVVAARKNGPFISIEDLSERTKLSQTDIETLRKLRVLDGMGETNQMTLF
jgi:DNA polymerase-3 subunit alpha (Gram-positive type)